MSVINKSGKSPAECHRMRCNGCFVTNLHLAFKLNNYRNLCHEKHTKISQQTIVMNGLQPAHRVLLTRRQALSIAALSLPLFANRNARAQDMENDYYIDPLINEPEITDRVFLDLSVDNAPPSRIVIGLYGTIVPETVANFKALATSGYKGTKVYRIVPQLTIQMGDVLNNGGKSGRAATTDGSPIVAENFRVKHTMAGIVSMAHDSNGMVDSRFFIATRLGDSAYLDGKYCAFGRVVQNMELIYDLEKLGGNGIAVRRPVRIVDCGILL